MPRGRGVALRTKELIHGSSAASRCRLISESASLIIRKTGNKGGIFLKKTHSYLAKILLTALMAALKVVLDRFLSYNVWNQRIGFAFIAVAFSGAMLGIPWAMLTAGIGDVVGALLFPTGAYFPGFTLTAVLMALCTAVFINKNSTLPRISASVIINQAFGSVALNSLWIAILNNKKGMPVMTYYFSLLPVRAAQAILMTVIQIISIYLLFGEKSSVRARLSKAMA